MKAKTLSPSEHGQPSHLGMHNSAFVLDELSTVIYYKSEKQLVNGQTGKAGNMAKCEPTIMPFVAYPIFACWCIRNFCQC